MFVLVVIFTSPLVAAVAPFADTLPIVTDFWLDTVTLISFALAVKFPYVKTASVIP